jgi:very-short-patch-repair endonuclease
LLESPKRKTIGYYNKLFAVQQIISSDSVDSPIELAWGVGFSLWSLSEKQKVIEYPIITQSCEIQLNQITFEIEIRPRDLEPKLELSCYEDSENQGVRSLLEFWKNANENSTTRINPFEASTYEAFLNAAVLYLDSNGLYLSNQPEPILPIPTDNLTITDTWVLFVRKRSEHIFIQDIERLKHHISIGIEIPTAIEKFVQAGDSVVRPRETVKFRGLSSSDARSQGIKELYFPMPYNDEQVSIIEKLELSDGVVVQGPPGTGKTHTIANVICHFLAQGKRVLVTAAGESALTVLQEKLPQKIRPLSVALITDERDGKKQFEFSIQKIASTVNSLNPNQVLREIESLESQLDGLHAKISAIDQNINSFAEKNMKYYTFQGKEILLAELAKFVLEHQVYYDWLEDVISSKCSTLQFNNDDIRVLRSSRSLVGDDIFNIENSFPVCDDFPSWHILAGLHSDLIHAEELRDRISIGEVLPLADIKPELLLEAKFLLEFLIQYQKIEAKLMEECIPWTASLREKLMQSTDTSIKHFLSLCEDISALDIIRRNNLVNAVSIPGESELSEDFIQAIQRLSQGKSAFKLFGTKTVKQQLTKVLVMGVNPKPKQNDLWLNVVNHIEYLLKVRKILSQWNAVCNEIGINKIESELDNSFRSITKYAIHIIELQKFVENYDRVLNKKISNVFNQSVTEITHNSKDRIEEIKVSLIAHLDYDRFEYARQQIAELNKKLDGHSGYIINELYVFFNDLLGNFIHDEGSLKGLWHEQMLELSRLNSLQPAFREIQRVSSLLLDSGAPKWANKVRSIPYQENENITSHNWQDAWEWCMARTLIEGIDGHQKLKLMFDERLLLEKMLSNTYQELIAEKTWLGVYNNSPNNIRQALKEYLIAIRNMGSGNGIRAIRHRKDARNAMERAYKAVPCWILPQWRVSETIPSEVGLFDLVIIDEASQSDIWALPALLRGKKVLVVGDDKQVSPSLVAFKEFKINELRDRFLNNQPHSAQMLPGKSIYDLASVVFAGNEVMLKEHFRCAHPIIEFSNREFYDGEIKPLRIPKSSERLNPVLIDVKVLGGFRKGDINPPEARAIVDEIKAIIADPKMTARTIGVVTLLGTEQAKRISDMINIEISQADIIERSISVGAPPVFQGRERDIMLISNVLQNGNQGVSNALIYQQRFNVALSRARDRMYLFRSIDEDQINPDSLTSKVFRHFTQPFMQNPNHVASLRELCESNFEIEVFDELVKRNYYVKPQVSCGAYRIDFVVEGAQGRRLAIECDGDKYHGPNQWMNDMIRQRILERAGWTFWRCFASSFVMRREEVLEDLFTTLNEMGIDALGSELVDNSQWVGSKVVDPYEIVNEVNENVESETLTDELHENDNVNHHNVKHESRQSSNNMDIFEEDIVLIENSVLSDNQHRLDISDLEIQQTILNVISNCPNQSCTVDSVATKVLKELSIITRGKPRMAFEKKVTMAINSLIRKNKALYGFQGLFVKLDEWKIHF